MTSEQRGHWETGSENLGKARAVWFSLFYAIFFANIIFTGRSSCRMASCVLYSRLTLWSDDLRWLAAAADSRRCCSTPPSRVSAFPMASTFHPGVLRADEHVHV
jgi:hypothetical protein